MRGGVKSLNEVKEDFTDGEMRIIECMSRVEKCRGCGMLQGYIGNLTGRER